MLQHPLRLLPLHEMPTPLQPAEQSAQQIRGFFGVITVGTETCRAAVIMQGIATGPTAVLLSLAIVGVVRTAVSRWNNWLALS